jgi:hypothetical protein
MSVDLEEVHQILALQAGESPEKEGRKKGLKKVTADSMSLPTLRLHRSRPGRFSFLASRTYREFR